MERRKHSDLFGRGAIVLLLIVAIFSCNLWAQDSIKQTTIVEKQHNPNTSLMLSIIPGGGQIYNRQAWKVPIIYGALGTVGYFTYSYYNDMKTFKDEYLYRVNHNNTPRLEEFANRPTQNIYNLYESYNRNFQLFVFVDIAVYALNLLDAYVFANLFDFDIDDNLAFQTFPSIQYRPELGVTTGINLNIRF